MFVTLDSSARMTIEFRAGKDLQIQIHLRIQIQIQIQTLDSSARMTIVFRAGEDLQTVVCPRTQYVTLRFNQCVPLLLIPIVLIIRTPFILGVTVKDLRRAVF